MALTPLKISAMTAGAALGGTEIIPMVQTANNRYATPTTIKDYTMGFALSKAGDTGVGTYYFLQAAHTPQVGATGTFFHVSREGDTSRFLWDNYNSAAGGSNMTFRKARGTAAAPSAILTSDQMLNIASFGYGATGYSSGTRGGITVVAAENWTDIAQGAILELFAADIGGVGGVNTSRIQITTGALKVGSGFGTSMAVHMNGSNVVFDTDRNLNLRSYTVATLPTPGTAGRVAWASNCRVFNGAGVQEGAGVGTGGMVTDNGTAWKIAGTNVTAVA